MSVRPLSLDPLARQHLFCGKCSIPNSKYFALDRKLISKKWHLKCGSCERYWSEESIRAGKAEGIIFLG